MVELGEDDSRYLCHHNENSRLSADSITDFWEELDIDDLHESLTSWEQSPGDSALSWLFKRGTLKREKMQVGKPFYRYMRGN
jgi:hypothetical protein